MIKRPVLPLMLLTLASIFLFFLLNLLLGSVHIPLRSVWNILWGNTDESVIWQNIIFSMAVVAFLIVVSFLGLTDIAISVIIHEGSTLVVILNGLRLLRAV